MAKITKKYHPDRKSPYQVLWREDGKKYSRFFESEKTRDEFVEMYSFLESGQFEVLMKMSKQTVTEVAKIEARRGEISFREIWTFWAKHHKLECQDGWSILRYPEALLFLSIKIPQLATGGIL